ncbi:hypothetical protein U2I54_21740 [Bacillus pseudomycoides]|uniref:Uncharacterized protein n=1 Tax=Bacillus bingmayongensis TaxID=1150157 RepID=A0ABU5K1V1_9BACI|nr:hypothetical protein [Bacillus pseudomycoides]
MECNGKLLTEEQVDKLQFMINNYNNKNMDICSCDVKRSLGNKGLELTKLEKAIALSIAFNAIDNKELKGHVSTEKIPSLIKMFEELQKDITPEEEKEILINLINKLIDDLNGKE